MVGSRSEGKDTDAAIPFAYKGIAGLSGERCNGQSGRKRKSNHLLPQANRDDRAWRRRKRKRDLGERRRARGLIVMAWRDPAPDLRDLHRLRWTIRYLRMKLMVAQVKRWYKTAA